MYEAYWGLTEKPFQNTPDPRFLYYSKDYEEAFSRFIYTIEMGRAAAVLTGIFGCGKTLLGRAIMAHLNKNTYRIVLINNPRLQPVELLRTIAWQLGARNLSEKLTEMSKSYFLQVIEEILFNNSKYGKRTIIIIDEAHTIMDDDIFEELRLLLNFQLEDRFLLMLILMGQPELTEKLKKNEPLAQRIIMGYTLKLLNVEETKNYIEHRLKVAGVERRIFSPASIEYIFKNSGGIPRRINIICDICLSVGFSQGIKTIDEAIVNDVAQSLLG